MLSAGKRIRDAHDRLSRIDALYLYQRIKHPSTELLNQLNALRRVYSLDKKRYNELKRELPYVVCAKFNPEFRLTQNFAYTDCFIIDIDHVSSQEIDIATLKMHLCQDRRVAMAFVSPSGDGLKLLFTLKEKCYDAGAFSAFYKAFVQQLALLYNITDMIDSRTNDVCRACFISHDPDAYFNPDAEPIDWSRIVAQATLSKPSTEHQVKQAATEDKPQQVAKTVDTPVSNVNDNDPDKEIMDRIKQQLNLSVGREKAQREFFVPKEIENVMTSLRDLITKTGIMITGERSIQYGKQLALVGNQRSAELNIFFGRRGFSVTESTRRGTSRELSHMIGELVRDYLATFSI